MRAPRNRWLTGGQFLLAAIVLFFIFRSLHAQWSDFSQHRVDLQIRWPYLLASAAAILVTFTVMIETWRRIVRAWGGDLGFADATRIWFTSNLAKYVPGAVVQLGAMAYMAKGRNVSGIAAGGAAVLNIIVNIATGIVIALALGSGAMHTLPSSYRAIGIALAVAGFIGLLLLPWIMPPLLRWAGRVTHRPIADTAVPLRAIVESVIGNIIAWAGYGIALQLIVPGVLGVMPGQTVDYVAAYAASYVVGYLALISPGGVGFREITMAAMLPAMVPQITVAQAIVVAVASRAVMTVLELVPGFMYLARSSSRRQRSNPVSSDGST